MQQFSQDWLQMASYRWQIALPSSSPEKEKLRVNLLRSPVLDRAAQLFFSTQLPVYDVCSAQNNGQQMTISPVPILW